jgi:hypothetical protein
LPAYAVETIWILGQKFHSVHRLEDECVHEIVFFSPPRWVSAGWPCTSELRRDKVRITVLASFLLFIMHYSLKIN